MAQPLLKSAHMHEPCCQHINNMQHLPTLRWPQLLRCYDHSVVCGTAAMQQLLLLCTAA